MPRIPQYNVPIEGPDLNFRADINGGALAAPGMAMARLGDAVTGVAAELSQQANIQRQRMEGDAKFAATQNLYKMQAEGDLYWQSVVQEGGDPNTWWPKYKVKLQEGRQKLLTDLQPFPELQQKFQTILETEDAQDAVRKNASVIEGNQNFVTKFASDAETAAREKVLRDPRLRETQLAQYDTMIDGFVQQGRINPDRAAALKQRARDNIGIDDYNASVADPKRRKTLPSRMGMVPPDPNDRARWAVGYLMEKGYPKHVAAGIVGNFYQESGGFSDDVIAGKRRGDKGTAWYAGQWRGSRVGKLRSYAAMNRKNPHDLQTQLDFFDWELRTHEAGVYERLMKTSTAQEAAGVATGYWRPEGYVKGGDPTKVNGYSTRAGVAAKLNGEEPIVGPQPGPGQGEMDPAFAEMSPEARLKLLAQMPRDVRQNNDVYEFETKTLIDDDLAAREQGGGGLELVEQDRQGFVTRVVETLGEDDAAEYLQKAAAADEVGRFRRDILPTASNAELAAIRSQMETVASSKEPGLEARVEAGRKIVGMIDEEEKQRREDPAAVADRDPRVQAAQAQGDRKAAVDYRIAVQGQMLGVNPIMPNGKLFPGIQPLRDTEAKQMADAITYRMGTGVAPEEAMRTILAQMVQAYGPQHGEAVFTQVMAKVYNADREPAEWRSTIAATVSEWASVPRNDVAGLQRKKLSDAKMATMQEVTRAATGSMSDRMLGVDWLPSFGGDAAKAISGYINELPPVAALNEMVAKPGSPIEFSRRGGQWMADKTKQVMGTMMTLSPPVPSGGGKPPAIAKVPQRDVEILWQHLKDPNLRQNRDRAVSDFRKIYGQKALDEALKAAGPSQ
jgi:Phage tail lysozyme